MPNLQITFDGKTLCSDNVAAATIDTTMPARWGEPPEYVADVSIRPRTADDEVHMADTKTLRANAHKPVQITREGNIFIGDDEFPYPVAAGSIKIERAESRHCLLTLSILVGDVTIQPRKTRHAEAHD